MAEHLGEGDVGARRQGMVPGRHQHEPVLPEREGLERAGIDRARQDAEIGRALGHQPDDLLGGALLDLDPDPGMGGQEGRERVGQELGQRVGVRQDPDLPDRAAREHRHLLAQALDARQHLPGMGQERAPGRGRADALPPRVRRAAPRESSISRIRVEAAARARFARAAPWVIEPASTTCRNRPRSTRSNRIIAGGLSRASHRPAIRLAATVRDGIAARPACQRPAAGAAPGADPQHGRRRRRRRTGNVNIELKHLNSRSISSVIAQHDPDIQVLPGMHDIYAEQLDLYI